MIPSSCLPAFATSFVSAMSLTCRRTPSTTAQFSAAIVVIVDKASQRSLDRGDTGGHTSGTTANFVGVLADRRGCILESNQREFMGVIHVQITLTYLDEIRIRWTVGQGWRESAVLMQMQKWDVVPKRKGKSS